LGKKKLLHPFYTVAGALVEPHPVVGAGDEVSVLAIALRHLNGDSP
jgi:hypothetical protein